MHGSAALAASVVLLARLARGGRLTAEELAGGPRWRAAFAAAALAPAAGTTIFEVPPFELEDVDGDGCIDKMELMDSARAELDKGSHEEKKLRRFVYRYAEQMYDTCDIDGDGRLCERELEFAAFLSVFIMEYANKRNDMTVIFSDYMALEMLREIDPDGDGRLAPAEFQNIMRARVGTEVWDASQTAPGGGWAQTIFAKADIDGDGFLNPRETQYADFVGTVGLQSVLTEHIFGVFDTDGDRMVRWPEVVEAMLRSRHEMRTRRTIKDSVLENFAEMDANGDRALEEEEVEAFVVRLMDQSWSDG